MHEEIFSALDGGATVVTATHRLARVLIENYHASEIARGQSIWNVPDVLPLDAFLERLWRDWLLREGSEESPCLLRPAQEQMIWEQIVLESPAGQTLLQVSETARSAMETWTLIQAYRLRVDGRFEATDDGSAFRSWSASFRERCQANRWLEAARLSDFLMDRLKASEVAGCGVVYSVGFDDLTPQQAELFEFLRARPVVPNRNFEAAIGRRKAPDETREVRAAAEWAGRLLEQEPNARIGVVAPNLTRLRSKIERIFREELETRWTSSDRERIFHISLGPPLSEHPLVHAALLMLEFAFRQQLSLPQAGMLLRSPFLGGAERERSERASLDARLRKHGRWDVTTAQLQSNGGGCPVLQSALARLENERKKLPERQSASDWIRSFGRILEALGWPGDRPLTSREHQLMQAWGELLSNFAALDIVIAPTSFAQAVSRLREMAARAPFQVENEGAAIQIMGMLETAGQEFDHLWIMGLDDETLPAAANPNPFVPIALQRQYRLPHCSSEQEAEFAKNQLTRLLGSARQVVISYSEADGDRLRAPSPLIAGGAWQAVEDRSGFTGWIATMRADVSMESLEDWRAPATAAGMQTGGSSLFKDMAACPFRAFAKHRLHAKPLEDPVPGLSYSDRGRTVHKALELIWGELGTQRRLMELGPDELRALVSRHAGTAVQALGIGAVLERKRIQRLVLEWLEIEKRRDPFTVRHIEHKCNAEVAGLEVKTRADRVDELADGREIILDYKTGQLSSNGWRGDRPEEPQLPLYCGTNPQAIAGAAFAVIRTGELAFRGLTDDGVSLPSMKKMTADESGFRNEAARWQHVLAKLAEDFQAGVADVDPKINACDNCGLTALCRIQECQR